MPNIKSAKKRAELNAERHEINKTKRSALRTAVKRVAASLTSKAGGGEAQMAEAARILDKAAAAGVIPKNRAARQKSRLARRMNSMV